MVKASELPTDLLHAFVDAIEAWGMAEHDLFMLWQLLDGSRDLSEALGRFTSYGTAQQRKETERLIQERVHEPTARVDLLALMTRVRVLAETRNRIVHGRWQRQEVMENGRRVEPEYLRIYDARNEPARPRDEVEEQSMLGRSRFYAPELREAEQQFRELARDLHLAVPAVLPIAFKLRS